MYITRRYISWESTDKPFIFKRLKNPAAVFIIAMEQAWDSPYHQFDLHVLMTGSWALFHIHKKVRVCLFSEKRTLHFALDFWFVLVCLGLVWISTFIIELYKFFIILDINQIFCLLSRVPFSFHRYFHWCAENIWFKFNSWVTFVLACFRFQL